VLKLTKKADYGLMAMKHLAEHVQDGACSAKDVADAYAIPPEALAKILQRLVKAGLLKSLHGMNGGYTLARDARIRPNQCDGSSIQLVQQVMPAASEPSMMVKSAGMVGIR